MTLRRPMVFLVEFDNTLIDNDGIKQGALPGTDLTIQPIAEPLRFDLLRMGMAPRQVQSSLEATQ